MSRYVFKMPDIGEGIVEAEIVEWRVKMGDMVAEDAPVVDVMTDKATVEISAPVTGTVVAMGCDAGETIAIGAELIVFESNTEAAAEEATPPTMPEPESEPAEAIEPDEARALPAKTSSARPLASPAVRRRARELGIELSTVVGSGPKGRVRHEDLKAGLATGRDARPTPQSARAPQTGIEEIKIIGLRRKIAERMQDAKQRIPHFAYVEEVDVTELEALRKHLNTTHGATRGKLTLLPLLIQALLKTLPQFPQCNAHFEDDRGVIVRHDALHVGIATQTPNGLMVPVLRHAEALDLWGMAAEIRRLSDAARTGKPKAEELKGSTLTITSLGPLGGIVTTPVINSPEVAILGVNKMVERPMVVAGRIEVRKMMNLSSSFDHRVVDGYDAAQMIQHVRALLEHPATLFME